MRSYLDILFEDEQSTKLEILSYLLTLKSEDFLLYETINHIPSVKSIEKLRDVLQDISEDFQSNYYQSDDCHLDTQNYKIQGFNSSELEQLKRYYLENSMYFKIFDAFLIERYLSSEVIAEECGISIFQYYRAVRELGRRLERFSIGIKNRQLVGKEYFIRFISSHIYGQYLRPDSEYFGGEYDYCDRQMQVFTDGFLKAYPPIERHWLAVCFFITKNRIRENHFFQDDSMNVLMRDDLFTHPSKGADIAQDITKRFISIASNQAIVKLKPEILHDEVIYFLQIMPLSGFRYTFDINTVLNDDVKHQLAFVNYLVEEYFGKCETTKMPETMRTKFTRDIRALLLSVIACQDLVSAQPKGTVNHDIFTYYPIGSAIAAAMLTRILEELITDGSFEKRYFWGVELYPDFCYNLIADIDNRYILPEVKVLLDFSHAFNAPNFIATQLSSISEANIKIVDDPEEAEILITNVGRNPNDTQYALQFFFNSLPDYKEFQDVKDAIVAYSAKKYAHQ
jgi:hypothetical protein